MSDHIFANNWSDDITYGIRLEQENKRLQAKIDEMQPIVDVAFDWAVDSVGAPREETFTYPTSAVPGYDAYRQAAWSSGKSALGPVEWLQEENKRLKAQVGQLTEALQRYGDHDGSCNYLTADEDGRCSCGFTLEFPTDAQAVLERERGKGAVIQEARKIRTKLYEANWPASWYEDFAKALDAVDALNVAQPKEIEE